MKKQLEQLIEWHTKFDVPFKTAFDMRPYEEKEIMLRERIMIEETKEWSSAALYEHSIDQRAKELADMLYTVFGTIITEGLQDLIEGVFDRVHESNMSKLGADGKPFKRADGKILKGENYKEPDLEYLHEHVYYPPDNTF